MSDPVTNPKRVLVILNPQAGSAIAAEVHEALNRYFIPDQYAYDLYETTGDEQIAEIVRSALDDPGYDLVIAIGGDGTVSEVADAVAHTGTPLGIIPLGTANVLARELDIPVAIDAAFELLVGDHIVANIDAMEVNGKHYVLQIGIGIDSLMIRDTDREAKRRFGRLAYLWTAFTRLLGYQPRRFTLLVDNQRARPRALQVLVANGGVMGVAPLRWGPHIQPDDGKIDVCVVYARTLLDYLLLFWHTLLSRQHEDHHIKYYVAERSITITTDRPLPIQADGEIIGETPVQIRVVPSAVHVIVPGTAEHVQSQSEPELVEA